MGKLFGSVKVDTYIPSVVKLPGLHLQIYFIHRDVVMKGRGDLNLTLNVIVQLSF